MVFQVDLGRQRDPVALFERLVRIVPAGEADKLDVLHAAGHGEAAGHKAVLARARGLAHLRKEAHGLAVVFLHIVHAVHIENAEKLRRDLDDRGLDVERQRVGDVVVSDRTVAEFIGDVTAAAGLAHQLVDELAAFVVVDLFRAVDDQQLAGAQLVQQQRAHGVVARIGLDRRAVGRGQALVDDPVLRQRVGQVLQKPHAVVFDHNPAAAALFGQALQVLGVELALVRKHLDRDAAEAEAVGVVFLLALLAHKQQRFVAGVELGVLHRLLDELGLAALHHADEKVDGDLFGCHSAPP